MKNSNRNRCSLLDTDKCSQWRSKSFYDPNISFIRWIKKGAGNEREKKQKKGWKFTLFNTFLCGFSVYRWKVKSFLNYYYSTHPSKFAPAIAFIAIRIKIIHLFFFGWPTPNEIPDDLSFNLFSLFSSWFIRQLFFIHFSVNALGGYSRHFVGAFL